MDSKTNTNLLWWILGGGLLAYLFGNGKQIVDDVLDLSYKVSNVKVNFNSINFGSTNLTASADVTNNTAVAVPVDNVIGSVFYRNNEIGVFNITGRTFVAANDTTTIPFSIALNNAQAVLAIVDDLTQAARNGASVPPIVVTGAAVVAGVRIPFSENILG